MFENPKPLEDLSQDEINHLGITFTNDGEIDFSDLKSKGWTFINWPEEVSSNA